ncbi:hypothetical protein GBM03_06595 [Yersinia pseudotuberculosis]|nr:hypothetical protein [Yersinia pseudotuberculosis]MBO1569676.1 hypothetical protein [Yersinia pseudotuberculosis]MBO1584674.1 hypothetical protein [Yersinia pseudotuberculosis]MBO1634235.1 hypothetical protein [Yersinia pseudotuberculosis]
MTTAYKVLPLLRHTYYPPYSILHTPYSILHTPYFILHTSYFILHTSYFILQTACALAAFVTPPSMGFASSRPL